MQTNHKRLEFIRSQSVDYKPPVITFHYHGYQEEFTGPFISPYGTVIGIGITPFVFGHYWDSYYTNYPWYPQRQYWSNRPYNQPHYVRPAVVHRAPVANVQPVRPPNTAPVQVRPVRPAPAARAPQVRAPQQRSVAPPSTQRSAPSAHVSPVRP